MNFETYLNNAWNEHVTDSQAVFANFPAGIELLSSEQEVLSFIHLVLHVCGEHLQNFAAGVVVLKSIEAKISLSSDTKNIVKRAIGILELASGYEIDLASFSTSDQIIIHARLAAIKTEMKKIAEAKKAIDHALNLIQLNTLPEKDPAFRILAIVGNNAASGLEEKLNRNSEENELMIFMAQIARIYWEKAGTWVEVERAEYRLANSNLAAQIYDRALLHAENCLSICQENNAPALEFFFGYEVLAKVERARNNKYGFDLAVKKMQNYFTQLVIDDQNWCKDSLQKIENLSAL